MAGRVHPHFLRQLGWGCWLETLALALGPRVSAAGSAPGAKCAVGGKDFWALDSLLGATGAVFGCGDGLIGMLARYFET